MSASSNSLEATHLGGTDSGAANTIAFNGEAGVQVAAGTGNSILRNFLFSNGGLGIDLRENTTDNRTRPAKRRVGKNGMGSDKRFRLRVLVLLAAVVLAAGLLLLKTKPAEATFPGDNGRIAFVSDRTTGAGVDNPTGDLEVFTINLNGTGLTQLTFNTVSDSTPNWSPDGTRIAFLSNRDGNFEVYRKQVNGSLQTLLSNNPALDGDPDWQPLKQRRR